LYAQSQCLADGRDPHLDGRPPPRTFSSSAVCRHGCVQPQSGSVVVRAPRLAEARSGGPWCARGVEVPGRPPAATLRAPRDCWR